MDETKKMKRKLEELLKLEKKFKKTDKLMDKNIDWWYDFITTNKNNKEIDWWERCETMLDNFTNAYYNF